MEFRSSGLYHNCFHPLSLLSSPLNFLSMYFFSSPSSAFLAYSLSLQILFLILNCLFFFCDLLLISLSSSSSLLSIGYQLYIKKISSSYSVQWMPLLLHLPPSSSSFFFIFLHFPPLSSFFSFVLLFHPLPPSSSSSFVLLFRRRPPPFSSSPPFLSSPFVSVLEIELKA